MKRRRFGLLSGSAIAATLTSSPFAYGNLDDAATLLSTTLTPLGAERAGNAAGTIPAWTGGFSDAGSWDPATQMLPDFFAEDKILYTVDASNLAQYTNLLSEGAKLQIQKYGLKLNVYETRRNACAPQYVYNNTVSNAKTAQLDPAGGRFGFTGAYGGVPFPIPNISVPLDAGAQIMWNHSQRWNGVGFQLIGMAYSVTEGAKEMTDAAVYKEYFPYYEPNGSLSSFNGENEETHERFIRPATLVGGEIVTRQYTNSLVNPDITWELLEGQSRVRKAPEIEYDTPSNYNEDIANYDEAYGFAGDLHLYDWTYVKKQEMLVPYNCNKMRHSDPEQVVGVNFIDPSVVRWELHRVWVVDATVHPGGSRNVLHHRRMYVDEDTWTVLMADCYDANGVLYHFDVNYLVAMPNMPGMLPLFTIIHNVQTGNWTTFTATWGVPPCDAPIVFGSFPSSTFDPQTMAAQASY